MSIIYFGSTTDSKTSCALLNNKETTPLYLCSEYVILIISRINVDRVVFTGICMSLFGIANEKMTLAKIQ